ncbi:MDC1 protein, partial [Herpetotheres cachinnans]|nr:MDC1 protein [Herpetotheres cachinnans]
TKAQNADVTGSQKGRWMLVVDSDTDVEEDISNPDVGCPESHRTVPRDPDVKTETPHRDAEGRGALLLESDTDVEEDISNPDVEAPKPHRAARNVPRKPHLETGSPSTHAEGPQNKHQTLVVDSDTDVEENEVNPDVGCRKPHRITCKDPDVGMENANPDGWGVGRGRGLMPWLRPPQEEEKPPEVVGPQLRPRGGPGSAHPKVLFTGVVASPGMEVALRTLRGSMATSIFDCTHLVTDRIRRTVKFLCAVARGIPIVTPEWLQKSAHSGRVLAPDPFLVRDSQQERHFGFSLAQALCRARCHPLLQGYEVHVTPNVRPEPEHMRDIITCSGGTFLPTMPHTYKVRGQRGQ